MTCKVKCFENRKGYDFIEIENDKYFIHFWSINGDKNKTLKEREYVEFEVIETIVGLQIKHIHSTKSLQTIK